MTAPDPLAVRGYNAETKRRRRNAERALSEAAKKVEQLRKSLAGDGDPGRALGDAQRLGADVAELVVHLAGLAALHDVKFLTDDPDTEER